MGQGGAAERGELVVRAPNHLGDLVMALPALEAAAGADIVVRRWLVPLLELAPALPAGGGRRIVPLDAGARGMWRAAAALRSRRYRRGVLLTPSFSSALLFAVAGVGRRRGVAADARGALLHDAVPPERLAGLHRSARYRMLVTGERPGSAPVPALSVGAALRDRWRALAGPADGPVVGLFPGSNAPSRRWDAERYAELAERLAGDGVRVVVLGGPGERALTARVAGRAGLDAGGRTDLPLLAAALACCDLLVTNDSGPMHLAAAVGTPTLSLQGPADPAETRPLGPGHELLRYPPGLPCMPCVRNVCPRRGAGYVLADARRECMRLIEVDAVVAAVRARLARATGDPG